jgi:hypothetical protein
VSAAALSADAEALSAGMPSYGLAPSDFEISDSPFYIYVEKGSFSMTVFMKDENGLYTVPLKTFPTAIGRANRMTPTGVFHKGRTELWHSWGNAYSPYVSAYYAGLYVHGPLYAQKSFPTLYRNMASQIGSAASSGCLRTTAQAAYFVYEHCPEGTAIHIVDGSPIGYHAEPLDMARQAVDPAGETLDDIFPNLAGLTQEIEAKKLAAGNNGAAADGGGLRISGQPHSADEKRGFMPFERIRLSQSELALEAPASSASPARPADSGGAGIDVAGLGEASAADAASDADLGGSALEGAAPGAVRGVAEAAESGAESGAGRRDAASEAKLAARVYPPDAGDAAVLWMSSDASVATVSGTGLVAARAPGSARIFALSADGMASAFCDVSVSEAGADAGTDARAQLKRAGGSGSLFGDVGKKHWARPSSETLARLCAVDAGGIGNSGMSDFNPDNDITEAEFIKMLAQAMKWRSRGGGPAHGGSAAWYASYAEAASRHGVFGSGAADAGGQSPSDGRLRGGAQSAGGGAQPATDSTPSLGAGMADAGGAPPTGGFEPGAYLTRGKLSRWLAGAMGADGAEQAPNRAFTDMGAIEDIDAARAVERSGLLNGFSDGSFRQGRFITRAMAAVIICNFRSLRG